MFGVCMLVCIFYFRIVLHLSINTCFHQVNEHTHTQNDGKKEEEVGCSVTD